MSAGGTGQAVCLHLIITVPYSPAGGHAALIIVEMSYADILTHMNYIVLHMGSAKHASNFVSPSFSTVNFLCVIFLPVRPCFGLRMPLCLGVELNLNFQ